MDCFSDFWRVPCWGCIENSTLNQTTAEKYWLLQYNFVPSLSSNTAMSTKSLILSSTVWLLELSLHMKKKILTKWFQIVSTSHTYRCDCQALYLAEITRIPLTSQLFAIMQVVIVFTEPSYSNIRCNSTKSDMKSPSRTTWATICKSNTSAALDCMYSLRIVSVIFNILT